MNTMVSHDDPIPRKKNREKQTKKSKSDQADAALSEDVHTYSIDHLNLGEPKNDSKSNSKLEIDSR